MNQMLASPFNWHGQAEVWEPDTPVNVSGFGEWKPSATTHFFSLVRTLSHTDV